MYSIERLGRVVAAIAGLLRCRGGRSVATADPQGKVAAQQWVVYTARMKQIVSIQSAVAFGHVGNSAAIFALRRMGVEAWPVDTVQFSNHPGHGGKSGRVVPAAEVAALIDGLDRIGTLAAADGLLSGYLGEAATAGTVARAAGILRRLRPDAIYLCDPVMGDWPGGLYVAADIPAMIRDGLLPLADLATPNRFELEVLAGHPVADLAAAVAAARVLLARPGRLTALVVTGMESPDGQAASLAVDQSGAWVVATPRLDFAVPPNGTGDLLAALLIGHRVAGVAVPEALGRAVSSLFAVLETTRDLGRRELALVAAQDALADPPRRFTAVPWPG
jgi:pyridoxine kinase